MPTTIQLTPHEDGHHWRGATSEDEALISEIMAEGVPGAHPCGETLPRDGTLGGFCRKALGRGCQVLTADVEPDED